MNLKLSLVAAAALFVVAFVAAFAGSMDVSMACGMAAVGCVVQDLKEEKEALTGKLVELKDGLEEGGTFTTEQLKQWDDTSAEIGRINAEINTQERLLSLSPPKPDDGPGEPERRFSPQIVTARRSVDHAAAVRGWALSQLNRREFITSDMQTAQRVSNLAWDAPIQGQVKWDHTVTGDAADGALGGTSVNDAVVGEVVRKMKHYGGMMEACYVFSTTDGAAIKKPVHDNRSFRARKTAELGTIENEQQKVGSAKFGSMELTSGVYETSMQLVRDSAYDILGEFTLAIGESFGRGSNFYLTTGDGTDEPEGIEEAVTAIAPTEITYANLLRLFHSVNQAYRNSMKCCWMMNDNTLFAVKEKLIDADGRPIYKVAGDAVSGYQYMIEGKPVKINPDLSNGEILFGDFNRYHIRLIGGINIRLLNELFALRNAVGIVGHTAIDGRLVDSSAIRKMSVPGVEDLDPEQAAAAAAAPAA